MAGANKSAKGRSPRVKKHEDSTRRVTVGERTTAVTNREGAVTAHEEIAKRREGAAGSREDAAGMREGNNSQFNCSGSPRFTQNLIISRRSVAARRP